MKSFIIKLFTTAGSQERADSLQTILYQKEMAAAAEMESFERMLKILAFAPVLGIFVMIGIIVVFML